MALYSTRQGVLERLDAPLHGELSAALSSLGIGSATIVGRWSGGTASCYLLRLPDRSKVVLKVGIKAEQLDREFAMLAAIRDIAKAPPCPFPKPLWLSSDGAAYLMEHLPGQPIARALASNGAGVNVRSIASELVAVLRWYYDQLGEAYGDWHDGNVLLARGGALGLLDPTPSTSITRVAQTFDLSPIEADMGIWLYNIAIDTPRRLITSPLAARRLIALTFAMLDYALAGQERAARAATLAAIQRVAGAYVTERRSSQWPGSRLVGHLGVPVLAILCLRARQRSERLD